MNTPGTDGPYVTPGDYRVDLVANGEVVDSKPMTVHQDPEVRMGTTERIAYDNILNDLHDLRREGTGAAARLTRLYRAMEAAAEEIENSEVPGDVEDDFEAFREEFDELRGLFGVPLGQRRFGGGDDNALGAVAGIAGEIGAFWETPSDALVERYYDARADLVAAMRRVDPFMERARAMSASLDDAGITMEVPGGM